MNGNMDELVLDASAIDNLDDFELTGEYEEGTEPQLEPSQQPETPDPQEPEPPVLEPPVLEPDSPDNTDDFTKEILRIKGILDPTKIKFEDESGAIVERDWKDLTLNEKLSIMTLEEDTETDLEEEEISFINMLRENSLTPSKYLELLKNDIIQHVLDNQPTIYEIDSLNDDELFALDLIEKLGEENVTDEELLEMLTLAKNNPTLYKKLVDALREHYKDLENQKNYEEEQNLKALLELDYQKFSEQILNLIEGFETIAGLEIELSVDDKNDIANYILTRDETGQSDFYKDLQNPSALTTAAFWVLKGPEIMQELLDQILKAYVRGFSLGSLGKTTPNTPPKVVITPKQTVNLVPVNNDASAAIGDDESYLYN